MGMVPNPYQSPVHGATEAKPIPRMAGSLIRIGSVTAVAGLLFIRLLWVLDPYAANVRLWFALAFFVSLAMVPIGTLTFAVGLIWWVIGWVALKAGRWTT